MLSRFEVENFKAFKQRLVLDFTAREYGFNPSLVASGIVKNLLIYGPNGVGKSCLGMALFDIVANLTDTMRFPSEYLVEYKNLDAQDSESVSFLYCFKFSNDEVVYEYSKNATQEFLREKLSFNGKCFIDWQYSGSRIHYVDEDLINGMHIEFDDANLSAVKVVSNSIPKGTVPLLDKMVEFVKHMLWYRSLSDGNVYAGFKSANAKLDNSICKSGKLNEFSEFLHRNGVDYVLSAKQIDNEERIFVEFNGRKKALFCNIASTGTKALELFYHWSVTAFPSLSFLFIDEFDAFLHYHSAAQIVERLNKAEFQVALTTHNTYLMQNKYTRPDCCFLMSKGGIKTLTDSTDREIREAHNLEKMYQNGVFTE